MSTQIRYRMENAIEPKDIATSDVIQAEIPEMENIHNLIWETQALMTLPEADERYIERWEQSLGIKSPSSHLEDRRRFLITSISSKQKTSSRTLEVHSETFTGVQNRVFIEGSTINIRFLGGLSDTSISRFRDFIELLIPAHLGLQIIIDVPMDELQYMYVVGGDQVSDLSLTPENRLSKFDGVELENLVVNGDFSQGATGWSKVGGINTIGFDEENMSFNGEAVLTGGYYQDVAGNSSDEFYLNFKRIPATSPIPGIAQSDNGSFANLTRLPDSENSTIVKKSNGIRLYITQHITIIYSGYALDNFVLINLTETFGAGNEPTKEAMDSLISEVGYFEAFKPSQKQLILLEHG